MTTNSADNFIFASSTTSHDPYNESYSDKKWNWQPDSNSGTYNNQVIFDLTNFSAEGDKYLSMSEAFITIPMVGVVSINDTNGNRYSQNDFCFGLKNSYTTLINSFTIDLDQKNIMTNNNFSNVPIAFKMQTTMSLTDNQVNALGFSLDTSDSWKWCASAPVAAIADMTVAQPLTVASSLYGNGMVNNINVPQTINANLQLTNDGNNFNAGLLKRQSEMYDPTPVAAALQVGLTLPFPNNIWGLRGNSNVNFNNEFKNYTVSSGLVAAGNVFWQAFYYTAIIRLRDLSNIFEPTNLALLKGTRLRIVLNMNVGSCNVQLNSAAAAANVYRTYMLPSGTSFNYTCPFVFNPSAWATVTPATATLTFSQSATAAVGIYIQKPISLGVANQNIAAINPHAMSSARLYCPTVQLKPALSSLLLENSIRHCSYLDVYQTQLSPVNAGNPFNFLVTNGFPRMQGVLVVPYVSSTVNGAIAGATGIGADVLTSFSPLVSPFTTEGATTSPLSITNFSVNCGGKQIFDTPENYTYEAFCQQMSLVNKINGGLSNSSFNGLIGKNDWENMYRYYWATLSRVDDSNKDVARAINISGVNNNNVAMDLLIFVFYEKRVNVNIASGAVEVQP